MAELKTNWEISQGIKFSKRGIIEEIERRLKLELPEIDNSWKQELKIPSLTYYLKKGGSSLNKT